VRVRAVGSATRLSSSHGKRFWAQSGRRLAVLTMPLSMAAGRHSFAPRSFTLAKARSAKIKAR